MSSPVLLICGRVIVSLHSVNLRVGGVLELLGGSRRNLWFDGMVVTSRDLTGRDLRTLWIDVVVSRDLLMGSFCLRIDDVAIVSRRLASVDLRIDGVLELLGGSRCSLWFDGMVVTSRDLWISGLGGEIRAAILRRVESTGTVRRLVELY